MKKIIRILFLSVIALMLISSCYQYRIIWLPTEKEQEDKTAVNTDWLAENAGTEKDPYIISTVGELRGLKELVDSGIDFANKHVELSAGEEYDLSAYPNFQIGSGDRKQMDSSFVFSGVLDGNNATIKGLNIKADGKGSDDNTPYGFIAIAKNATIKNLLFEDCSVDSGSSSTGIVTGYAEDTNFENVIIRNSIVRGAEGSGGLAGRLIITDTLNTYKISGCINENTSVYASPSYHSGGLIGYLSDNSVKGMKVDISGNKILLTDDNAVISSHNEATSGDATASSGFIAGSARQSNTSVFAFKNNIIEISNLNQLISTSDDDTADMHKGYLYGHNFVWDADLLSSIYITTTAEQNNTVKVGNGTVSIIVGGDSSVVAGDGEVLNKIQ